MKEVADLDGQLRQAIEEREAAVAANSALLNEQGSYESTAEVSERLLKTIEAHTATVTSEREELQRQHAADREFLNGMMAQLEAQLKLARTEREELLARTDRERRGAMKKIKDLEEALQESNRSRERLREQCDKEKEQLSKAAEQRIAGLRLERENAKVDKGLMRRLEQELAELKTLSSGFFASHQHQQHAQQLPSATPEPSTYSRGLGGRAPGAWSTADIA